MSSLDLLLKQIEDPSGLSWNEETYDVALASTLTADERGAFISRLIDAARADDPRAVLTLGHIGAVETLPALLMLATSSLPMAATARRAVVLLGQGGLIEEWIARDAVDSPIKSVRIAAVRDLAKLGGDVATDALLQALEDEDPILRELGWQGLIQVLGLDARLRGPDNVRGLRTRIELYSVWIGSTFATLEKMGVDAMREVVAKLRAGVTPESLDIQWTPPVATGTFQNIRLAMLDDASAYPLEEIKQLTGALRAWAETMILLRVAHGDARVPKAMAHLRAAWTVPVLEEVSRSPSTMAELRTALEESVRVLKAS